MTQSMTGFGASVKEFAGTGKIAVEIRSINHKFLETVFRLPEGFVFLEDRIKKEIESKIKRGRVSCSVSLFGARSGKVYINRTLLSDYLAAFKKIKEQFHVSEGISLDTLVKLPGVISLEEGVSVKESIWPRLRPLLRQAIRELVKTRAKEGRALQVFLKKRADKLMVDLAAIKKRFKTAVETELGNIQTDEARAGFLRDSDITEELERLEFHVGNFRQKLEAAGPVGKELDFIAQEMQREANTMGAKSFDVQVSARVVQIKSQIEKIREQAQNIE